MSETLNSSEASAPAATKVPVEISNVRPAPGQIALKAPRRAKPPKHIADFDMAGRREFLKELGYQSFRASQLSKHYFERLVTDPAEMTDLPAKDREQMVAQAMPQLLTPVRTLEADGGDTLKVVHRLFDGALIESVIMRYDNRVTMCISSQAGCGMNCPFCATGQQGLTRNLSTAEIVEQVVAGARYLKQMKGLEEAEGGSEDTRPLRVSNIVFMGMGEALANYKATMGAVHRLIDPSPEGLGISARGLTMSTVGLVPGIRKFELEKLPITLALSLHAPDDELRDELIPINQRWKVDETLDAAYDYYRTTGRRVSIEYALIRDINDQGWRADLLGKKLAQRGRGWVHVNPIPLNRPRVQSGRHPVRALSRTLWSVCVHMVFRRLFVILAVPILMVHAVSWLLRKTKRLSCDR